MARPRRSGIRGRQDIGAGHAAERQHEPAISPLGAHFNAAACVRSERHSQGDLSVQLVSFEPKFSPRNFIVVGRPASSPSMMNDAVYGNGG